MWQAKKKKKMQDTESKCLYPLSFGGCHKMNGLFQCQLILYNDESSSPPPSAPTVSGH